MLVTVDSNWCCPLLNLVYYYVNLRLLKKHEPADGKEQLDSNNQLQDFLESALVPYSDENEEETDHWAGQY